MKFRYWVRRKTDTAFNELTREEYVIVDKLGSSIPCSCMEEYAQSGGIFFDTHAEYLLAVSTAGHPGPVPVATLDDKTQLPCCPQRLTCFHFMVGHSCTALHALPSCQVFKHIDITAEAPEPTRVAARGDVAVDHPQHYGGQENTYEAIKVIEAWQLGFCLGNTIKYISRAGRKDRTKLVEDLKKAQWYLNREISRLEKEPHDPR